MYDVYLAQFLGFVGYALVAYSPRFDSKSKILRYETIGFVLVFAQFLLMDIDVAIYTSFINAYTALVGVLVLRCPFLAFLKFLGIPMLCGAAAMTYEGSLSFFCAILLIPTFMLAKFSKDIALFRLFSICAGVFWITFAAVNFVVPSLIFGCLFVYGHCAELWKLKDGTAFDGLSLRCCYQKLARVQS